jgi:hypothetical protein
MRWLFLLYQWVVPGTWLVTSRLGHFVSVSEEEIVSEVSSHREEMVQRATAP